MGTMLREAIQKTRGSSQGARKSTDETCNVGQIVLRLWQGDAVSQRRDRSIIRHAANRPEIDVPTLKYDRDIRPLHNCGRQVHIGDPTPGTALSRDLQFSGLTDEDFGERVANLEFRQFVDLVPPLLVELESDGTWIRVNRAAQEYTGLTLDEYRSVDVIRKVIHPDDVERMRATKTKRFSESAPFELDARMLGKDGVYRWFLFRYKPLIEDGRVAKWYGSATEIESCKREEERVRRDFARLEERTRIAQELHDTLLQSFFLATLQLGTAAASLPANSPLKCELNRILEIMDQGMQEGRDAILDLRSPEIASIDIVSYFYNLPQQLGKHRDVNIKVTVLGKERLLVPNVAHDICRIAREALVNALCHSGAKQIRSVLEFTENELRVRIHDNGKGFDPQADHSGMRGHCGLTGMRERAARIDGSLNIASSSKGTDVQLIVPTESVFVSGAIDPALAVESDLRT